MCNKIFGTLKSVCLDLIRVLLLLLFFSHNIKKAYLFGHLILVKLVTGIVGSRGYLSSSC